MNERLSAENLCKSYGGVRGLDGVTISVREGECVGVFGHSGSGKSVLLRMFAGDESADSGSVSPPGGSVGFGRQTPFLSGDLTPTEALWLYAVLYGIHRGKRRTAIRDVLVLLGLDGKRDQRMKSLSASARRRVELARAILCPSDLLLLDEPMTDLDAETRQTLWEHLLNARAYEGKTIVVATSRAEDADLCDRVIMLHEGRVIADGTPTDLRSAVGAEALVVRPLDSRGGGQKSIWSGILETEEEDDSVVIEVNPESPPVEILRRIPCRPSAIRMSQRGLDSVLDELVARAGDDV